MKFGGRPTLTHSAADVWNNRVWCITAFAIATISCCRSDVPSQWKRPDFDSPQLPHFSADFNGTQNQERYPGYDPTCKIWLMWDDGHEHYALA